MANPTPDSASASQTAAAAFKWPIQPPKHKEPCSGGYRSGSSCSRTFPSDSASQTAAAAFKWPIQPPKRKEPGSGGYRSSSSCRKPHSSRTFPSDSASQTAAAAFKSPIQPPKRKEPGSGGYRSSSSCRKPVTGHGDSSILISGSRLLKLFRKRCEEMMKSNLYSPRPDLKAYLEFKNEKAAILKKIKLYAEQTGPVPGVEVNDWFEYRAELVIAGVHGSLIRGISSVVCQGRRFATCVVAMEGHYDKMTDSDVLWYGGEGGGSGKKKDRVDQVMKGGNLAMKNSMEVKNDVRVVRGVRVPWKGRHGGKIVYVYDGLYQVVSLNTRKGVKGKSVFEFELKRKPGQPSINWKDRSSLTHNDN